MPTYPSYYLMNGISYCSPSCPYLQGDRESVNKTCTLFNQELDFYDWHLAICDEEVEKSNENNVRCVQ